MKKHFFIGAPFSLIGCVNAFGIGSAWDAVVVVAARFVAFAAKRTACARPDAARCTASPD
jgi:hypothetical protein